MGGIPPRETVGLTLSVPAAVLRARAYAHHPTLAERRPTVVGVFAVRQSPAWTASMMSLFGARNRTWSGVPVAAAARRVRKAAS